MLIAWTKVCLYLFIYVLLSYIYLRICKIIKLKTWFEYLSSSSNFLVFPSQFFFLFFLVKFVYIAIVFMLLISSGQTLQVIELSFGKVNAMHGISKQYETHLLKLFVIYRHVIQLYTVLHIYHIKINNDEVPEICSGKFIKTEQHHWQAFFQWWGNHLKQVKAASYFNWIYQFVSHIIISHYSFPWGQQWKYSTLSLSPCRCELNWG